jgi:hypothetical protein
VIIRARGRGMSGWRKVKMRRKTQALAQGKDRADQGTQKEMKGLFSCARECMHVVHNMCRCAVGGRGEKGELEGRRWGNTWLPCRGHWEGARVSRNASASCTPTTFSASRRMMGSPGRENPPQPASAPRGVLPHFPGSFRAKLQPSRCRKGDAAGHMRGLATACTGSAAACTWDVRGTHTKTPHLQTLSPFPLRAGILIILIRRGKPSKNDRGLHHLWGVLL